MHIYSKVRDIRKNASAKTYIQALRQDVVNAYRRYRKLRDYAEDCRRDTRTKFYEADCDAITAFSIYLALDANLVHAARIMKVEYDEIDTFSL